MAGSVPNPKLGRSVHRVWEAHGAPVIRDEAQCAAVHLLWREGG